MIIKDLLVRLRRIIVNRSKQHEFVEMGWGEGITASFII